jgi:hypothetical protein
MPGPPLLFVPVLEISLIEVDSPWVDVTIFTSMIGFGPVPACKLHRPGCLRLPTRTFRSLG